MLPRDDSEGTLAKVCFSDGAGFEFRAEFLRLFAHVLDELRPQNAVRETGEILNVRGERKLAAGLVAIENEGLQVRARSVNRGGEAGTATADDDDIVHSRFLQPLDSSLRPPDTAALL